MNRVSLLPQQIHHLRRVKRRLGVAGVLALGMASARSRLPRCRRAAFSSIDVGFGNTKCVTASANGKVDCAHFASLAFFGHTDEAAESMGEERRSVQVPVDGLFYEVGPDVGPGI